MNQTPISILILDDDVSLQTIFRAILEKAGYEVTTVSTAIEAKNILSLQQFNLALIDVKLPGPSGLELLQSLRVWQPDCATVLISAHANREDVIEALRAGADDFLIKPVANDHLRRAIGEALLKHRAQRPTPTEEISVGALRINPQQRMVYWHNEPLTLTATEYCLLYTLVQHSGRLVPASVLLRRCRGYVIEEDEARQLIKPHIANLRHKLEQGDRFKRILLNHRGLGFVLSAEETTDTKLHKANSSNPSNPSDW